MAQPIKVRLYAEDFADPPRPVGTILEEIANAHVEGKGDLPHYQSVSRVAETTDHNTIKAINEIRRRRPELTDALDGFYRGHKKKRVV